MAQGLDTDVRQLVLSNSTFGPHEIQELVDAVAEDYTQLGVLRDSVGELEVHEERSPATAVRLGVCYYLLGRYRMAIETLSNADGGALALFYLGKTYFAQQQWALAIQNYEAAKGAGYDGDASSLAIAEAQRYADNPEAALATLDNLSGAVEQTAEYLYQRATTVGTLKGNPDEVVALLERAVECDGLHSGALFGLARENDRRGNDDEAFHLYQRAAARFPAHVGSLINLGILYEDRHQMLAFRHDRPINHRR